MFHGHISRFLAVILFIGGVTAFLPATEAAGQGSRPRSSALLRHALVVMHASLHDVHATQHFRYIIPRKGTVSGRMQGDCVMDTRSNRVSVRYTVTTAGGAMPGSNHVVIMSPREGQTRIWERSAQTGYQWQRNDSDNGTLVFIYLCPALPYFLAGCINQQCTSMQHVIPAGMRNLGVVSIRGYSTWHLRTVTGPAVSVVNGPARRGTAADDFYIDRKTLFLVRWSYRNQGNVMVTDYSRFNQPVVITAPKTGSTIP